MNQRLLLFDVDGTLIRSDGAGRAAMMAALTALFGELDGADGYRMDGKTDPRIVTDLLTAAGIDRQRIESSLPLVYERMETEARNRFPQHDITPCPGVEALLRALRAREDVVLGLVTGNIAQTVPLKLQAAGLDANQFRLGAYGSDHADRNQLPFMAMKRASDLMGLPFSGQNTVVIGDTPADILCARAGEATAVAVASGWHAASTLAQYHPDHLFDNLLDTEAIMAALLDGP
ncbi:MAG: haloacid dehalogenase-like hydrolase [Chloroflexota bacterium]